MQTASLATLVGLAVHYLCFRLFGAPLLTDVIAEWIMARTPNTYSVWLLENLGAWAKPFAATGGLAMLGGLVWLARSVRLKLVAAVALAVTLRYWSVLGSVSFWLPVMFLPFRSKPVSGSRRAFLLTAGTAAVAVEAYWRESSLARGAARPVEIAPFTPPAEDPRFAHVRSVVTPLNQFYGMSKNTVDPSPDPARWRLKVYAEEKLLGDFGYRDLMSMPRTERYVTLRCISNTLRSNLMGNANWSGVRLNQLVDAGQLAEGFLEAAVTGADGHADSYPLDYILGEEAMLALGMNGGTLERIHGFPLRLLVPRYYGFKNVKWISEIRFVRQPFLGTWPKMGYTKDARVKTCSTIDRVVPHPEGLLAGGVAFAGSRGIGAVEVRAAGADWIGAELEQPLSPYAWTRWRAVIPANRAVRIEARARDGAGNWQAVRESALFPGGVEGPTIYSTQPK